MAISHATPRPTRSRLILGTAQLGQPYGTSRTPRPPSHRESMEILRTAQTAGIGWLDTARAYGNSEAEIGAARATGVARSMRLVSKVRPLDTEREATAPQVMAAVRASAGRSLAELRTGVLDVLLLHRAADAWIADGAAVRTLDSLVVEGTIRRWGISVSTPSDLITVLRLPRLSYIQLPFNLLDRRWLAPEAQSALAARPDVHVTARSALLQGLLTADDLTRWPRVHGMDPRGITQALARLVSELGRSDILDLCVAYVAGSTWIGSLVFGTRRARQLLSFLEAADRAALTPDQMRRVEAVLPAGPDELVNPALWPTATPLPTPNEVR